jgi:hypothetical protein
LTIEQIDGRIASAVAIRPFRSPATKKKRAAHRYPFCLHHRRPLPSPLFTTWLNGLGCVKCCGLLKGPRLREALSAGMIALEISSRNSRVAALQERRDRLRAGQDLILDQRSADMADLPGGASRLLVRDDKGNKPIGW